MASDSIQPLNLKLELVKLGISQVRMATDLGIHPSTLSRIVNGWLSPSPELEKQILDYLASSCEDSAI